VNAIPTASGAVTKGARRQQFNECRDDFAIVGVPTGLVLGVDRADRSILFRNHIEHAATAGNQRELTHDVLIVRHDLVGHAHGVRPIVSSQAVGDADLH
jgi:hypothetical protein